jgi:hypothetical protein
MARQVDGSRIASARDSASAAGAAGADSYVLPTYKGALPGVLLVMAPLPLLALLLCLAAVEARLAANGGQGSPLRIYLAVFSVFSPPFHQKQVHLGCLGLKKNGTLFVKLPAAPAPPSLYGLVRVHNMPSLPGLVTLDPGTGKLTFVNPSGAGQVRAAFL